MATSIQVYEQQSKPKSMATISAERTALRELLQTHMKEKVHYMTIPGTPKPSLSKPGSELILSMLHLAAEPMVEDLSTPDEMRYRVFVQITEMGTGRILGKGVGEASSAEAKYQWRGIVCQEEWETTGEDRRRVIWKKGNPPYPVQQVRTEMADVANTILKMAKKRAQIDATLTVTAASDLFMQDAEEVIAAGVELTADETGTAPAPRPSTLQPKAQANATPINQQPVTTKSDPPPAQQQRTAPAAVGNEPKISEAQGRRFYAIARGSGFENDEIDNYLKTVIGVSRKDDIPRSQYDAAVSWAGRQ